MRFERPGSKTDVSASDEALPSRSGDASARLLAKRRIAELAATLPGATSVFRRFRFDFCCMLDQQLDVVADWHETSLDEVVAALLALPAAVPSAAPQALDPLIGHILARYHVQHRAELPALVRLAETVEARHSGHPDLPIGLSCVLAELAEALDEQMRFEEVHLFPLVRCKSGGLEPAFATLDQRHHALEDYLCCLETVTAGQRPPGDACRRWCELFAGTERLVDDLIRHRHLETKTLAGMWRDIAAHRQLH